MERATLTRKEAAEYLGISPWLLWKLTKQGQIPHCRVASRILYRRRSLDEFLDEREEKAIF